MTKALDYKTVKIGKVDNEIVSDFLSRLEFHDVKAYFDFKEIAKNEIEKCLEFLRFSGKYDDTVLYAIDEFEGSSAINYRFNNYSNPSHRLSVIFI